MFLYLSPCNKFSSICPFIDIVALLPVLIEIALPSQIGRCFGIVHDITWDLGSFGLFHMCGWHLKIEAEFKGWSAQSGGP